MSCQVKNFSKFKIAGQLDFCSPPQRTALSWPRYTNYFTKPCLKPKPERSTPGADPILCFETRSSSARRFRFRKFQKITYNVHFLGLSNGPDSFTFFKCWQGYFRCDVPFTIRRIILCHISSLKNRSLMECAPSNRWLLPLPCFNAVDHIPFVFAK